MADSAKDMHPSLLRFHDLAPYRIRDILLVSSEYDAFVIEEDGRLSERLFVKFSEFYMVNSPRIVHAASMDEAFALMAERRFDLVLTTIREGEDNIERFVRKASVFYSRIPIVLLILDEAELRHIDLAALPSQLKGVFLWSGDPRLITAIISLVEDSLNVEADTAKTGIQVIITVEDSVSRYSVFLANLYEELMMQSRSLASEGVNFTHRILRMMTHPKILLAKNYEEAEKLFRKYRTHVLALISDIRFEKGGSLDDKAGFALAEAFRKTKPALPVLLQSSETDNRAEAEKLGFHFADKNSENLRQALRGFLQESLGFGDFVFRLPDRSEVARARDTYELERVLQSVDLRSIYYHAANNHFNVWLRARGFFELADQVERIQASSFDKHEDIRDYLVNVLHRYANLEQEGLILDYSRGRKGPAGKFVKVAAGSIGGKGRGIAFLHSSLPRLRFPENCNGIKVAVPRTVVLGSEAFDRFLVHNSLNGIFKQGLTDEQLLEKFLAGEMPRSVSQDLRQAITSLEGPLTVRSSSLLEDSKHQSCAGIYKTCFVPNNQSDPEKRYEALCQAVAKVYMSTYSHRARSYLENTPFSAEEEKMAVVIQEVVGSVHGNAYYPDISGVGLSCNYYPSGPQKPEDGVVMLCAGLGQTVVSGGRSVRFSPKWPKVLPHLCKAGHFLDYSQKDFYALKMDGGDGEGLISLPIGDLDSELFNFISSVYSPNENIWREGAMTAGTRAITFNNILKWETLPLPQVMSFLLERFSKAMGCPVELEFSLDLRLGTDDEAVLHLLQIRPIAYVEAGLRDADDFSRDRNVLCSSSRAMGHGVISELYDIIYVKPDILNMLQTKTAAEEISRLNSMLLKENRPYILIGPGRWGSADSTLGIPVSSPQIMGAKIIVELPFGDKDVEPSLGSHFFHELTALRIGYLTLNDDEAASLDRNWLLGQEALYSSALVCHIRSAAPLDAVLDGRTGSGSILLPKSDSLGN